MYIRQTAFGILCLFLLKCFQEFHCSESQQLIDRVRQSSKGNINRVTRSTNDDNFKQLGEIIETLNNLESFMRMLIGMQKYVLEKPPVQLNETLAAVNSLKEVTLQGLQDMKEEIKEVRMAQSEVKLEITTLLTHFGTIKREIQNVHTSQSQSEAVILHAINEVKLQMSKQHETIKEDLKNVKIAQNQAATLNALHEVKLEMSKQIETMKEDLKSVKIAQNLAATVNSVNEVQLEMSKQHKTIKEEIKNLQVAQNQSKATILDSVNEAKLELSGNHETINEEIRNIQISQNQSNAAVPEAVNKLNLGMSKELAIIYNKISNMEMAQNQANTEVLDTVNKANLGIAKEHEKIEMKIENAKFAQNQSNAAVPEAVNKLNLGMSKELAKFDKKIGNMEMAQKQSNTAIMDAVNKANLDMSKKLEKSYVEIENAKLAQNQALSAMSRILTEINVKVETGCLKSSNESMQVLPNLCTVPASNCKQLKVGGHARSGVQRIQPNGTYGNTPIHVYCDMEDDGGGWTIIQRRGVHTMPKSQRESFNRSWIEYENGFGSPDEDHWIGLRNMHSLTRNCENELKITLTMWNGTKYYGGYSNFKVSGGEDDYRLTIGRWTGGTLNHGGWYSGMEHNNRMKFSTWDKNNGKYSENCAVERKGAWWHADCTYVNLNGEYAEDGSNGKISSWGNGIYWCCDLEYGFMQSEMKIRPKC